MPQITVPQSDGEVEYSVNSASTGPFVVDFSFFTETDVEVTIINAVGVRTSLVHSSGFIFNQLDSPVPQEGNGYTGGEITLNSSVGADGDTEVRIFRIMTIDRIANYPATGPFNIPVLNDEQNRVVMMMQALFNNIWQLIAGTAIKPSLNMPVGIAPTKPAEGDMWVTSAGMFIYVNGAIQELLAAHDYAALLATSSIGYGATQVPNGAAIKALVDSNTTHAGLTNDPHNVQPSQIGLGNVDNQSAATIQAATTKGNVGLGNVDNTADLAKPTSTATQTKLDAKANKGANSDITSLTGLTTDLAIIHGGTGNGTAQEAIDALTQVSGATDEYILTKHTASQSAEWKLNTGAAGAGQTNEGVNLGAGEGIFFGMDLNNDLELKSLVAGKDISITSDADEITVNYSPELAILTVDKIFTNTVTQVATLLAVDLVANKSVRIYGQLIVELDFGGTNEGLLVRWKTSGAGPSVSSPATLKAEYVFNTTGADVRENIWPRNSDLLHEGGVTVQRKSFFFDGVIKLPTNQTLTIWGAQVVASASVSTYLMRGSWIRAEQLD